MTLLAGGATDSSEIARRRHSLLYGYAAGDKLAIDASLRLHGDEAVDLDAVTYAVIRSKLWNLNLDHGETVRRTSGSFPVADANDFNATITTETGEGTAFGPYNWFMAGYADLAIKWTLEHRSANPGIHEGDVFIHNDPWVGTNHQNDASVFAPVFWDGELFAWVYNCVHQRDIGGPVPGSMNPVALSVYDEGTFFPPVKLVEGGSLREDILDIWTRRSRLPEVLSLEVKAQLAGVFFAVDRLLDIVVRYGVREVKRAMTKTLDDSSRIVGERLAQLPDGVWRDERYLAGAGHGDVRPYKLCLSYEKRGDRLKVSNAGSDAAAGMLNFTFGALRGTVVQGLLHAFGFDLDMCGGGLLRQVDFDVEPGTMNAATHPSSVGASIGMIASCSQAQTLASKMVSGSPSLAPHGFSSTALHTLTGVGFWGTDQYGNPYQNAILDTISGGGGGFRDRDGIDHTGPAVGVSHPIPDVENVERGMPLLCLYRRELSGAGGHGQFRGGATIGSAWIGEGADDGSMILAGLLASVTMGRGLDGAPISTAGRNRHTAGSEVRDWLAQGRIPTTADDLAVAAPDLAPAMKEPRPFGPTSVYEMIANSGAGYGDPLRRDPGLVAADLVAGRVTADDASDVYGVVQSAPGVVDGRATTERRAGIVAARLAQSRPPRQPHDGRSDVSADAIRPLAGVQLGAADVLSCVHCGQHLAPRAGSYRLGCHEHEVTLPSVSSLFADPEAETGVRLVMRSYLCPGCGTALDAELCRADDEPYQDLALT